MPRASCRRHLHAISGVVHMLMMLDHFSKHVAFSEQQIALKQLGFTTNEPQDTQNSAALPELWPVVYFGHHQLYVMATISCISMNCTLKTMFRHWHNRLMGKILHRCNFFLPDFLGF